MQQTSNSEAGRGQLRLFAHVNVTPLIPKPQINPQTKQLEPVQKVEPKSLDHSIAANLFFYRFCSKCQREIALPELDAFWCAGCGWTSGGAV